MLFQWRGGRGHGRRFGRNLWRNHVVNDSSASCRGRGEASPNLNGCVGTDWADFTEGSRVVILNWTNLLTFLLVIQENRSNQGNFWSNNFLKMAIMKHKVSQNYIWGVLRNHPWNSSLYVYIHVCIYKYVYTCICVLSRLTKKYSVSCNTPNGVDVL